MGFFFSFVVGLSWAGLSMNKSIVVPKMKMKLKSNRCVRFPLPHNYCVDTSLTAQNQLTVAVHSGTATSSDGDTHAERERERL